MSLDSLKKEELQKAVDFFGVDVDPNSNREDLLKALKADGVDYKQYKKFLVPDEDEEQVAGTGTPVDLGDNAPAEEPRKAEEPNRLLVKMSRVNSVYEIGKYRWTKEHPFQLVDEADVDRIVRNYEGFSLATPNEAREFYS